MRVLDLFAGLGGWDVACRRLGWQVDGVEKWADARMTRVAAGLSTIHDDVTTYVGRPGSYDMLLGGPPCQTFSVSGKQAGMDVLKVIVEGTWSYIYPHLYDKPLTADELAFATGDDRTGLVLEPLRVALEIMPMFIALEQVKQVLPVWDACALVLRENGYSTATGVLRAEQFGVPQTRERAILVARRDGRTARLPQPTYSRFSPKEPASLDLDLIGWRSMARALWLDDDEWVGFPRKADGREEIILNGKAYRARDLRSARHPAFTVTEKARSWSRWHHRRKPVPLDISDALALQTFPEDHPVQGSRTSQFLQVANAIPPLLAQAVLTELVA